MAQPMTLEERRSLGINSLSQPCNANIVSGEYIGQKGTVFGEGPSHYVVSVSVFEGKKFVRHAGRLVFARNEVRLEA